MHRAPHGKRVWGGSAPKEADCEKLFHQAAGARSQKEALLSQGRAEEKKNKRRRRMRRNGIRREK